MIEPKVTLVAKTQVEPNYVRQVLEELRSSVEASILQAIEASLKAMLNECS